MPGRSTNPAKRTNCEDRRLAGVLLVASLCLLSPPARAQHAHPASNAPHSAAVPAPRFHAPAPAPRGGYLPQQHFQTSPPPRSPAVQPRYPRPGSSQPHSYDSGPAPRPVSPPAQRRPLITAQPFAPSPGTAGQPPIPRTQYVPPPATLERGNQQHLPGWLQSHSGQSFSSQEQSLRQEPGFSRLPQPQQQRLIDRLHQLDTMPPQRRERTLGRIENLERLSPDRRQQVRNSAQELGAMPEERKQQVRSAFRELRELPPEQRQQQLNSPAFRAQYNEHERQILGNLLSVEPY